MTGASRFLLGSVPQKVLEHAHCDVLIARTITQVSTEIDKGEAGSSPSTSQGPVYRNDDGELISMSAKCTHMAARSSGTLPRRVGLPMPRIAL